LSGWGIVVAGVLAGCGSRFDNATIRVTTAISAGTTPEQADAPFSFLVSVLDGAGNCPLSTSATLTINGQLAEFAGCGGQSPAFGSNTPFSLRISDGGDVGQMDVSDLAPGTAATLIPDTRIPAGSEFGISIPPELQGLAPGDAQFLDGTYGGWTSASASTSSDGTAVEVQAPAALHTFTVLIPMSGPPAGVPAHVATCTAFAHCAATVATVLGPVVLLVSPASTP
jgi:hypothetical protein